MLSLIAFLNLSTLPSSTKSMRNFLSSPSGRNTLSTPVVLSIFIVPSSAPFAASSPLIMASNSRLPTLCACSSFAWTFSSSLICSLIPVRRNPVCARRTTASSCSSLARWKSSLPRRTRFMELRERLAWRR